MLRVFSNIRCISLTFLFITLYCIPLNRTLRLPLFYILSINIQLHACFKSVRDKCELFREEHLLASVFFVFSKFPSIPNNCMSRVM